MGTILRDYTHARKIYIDGGYRLMPKYAFMFYVSFDINPSVTNMPSSQIFEAGLMVKSVSLPKFQMETKTLNAYNRNNIAQFKVKYMPSEITFHDDSADVVNQFWFDYFNFYYRDTDHMSTSFKTPYKYSPMNSVVGTNWGYNLRKNIDSSGGIANQYINAIHIFSLHQNQFTEYILENPTIMEFNHGELDQTDSGGLLKNTMRVAYESINYASGEIVAGGDPGFVTAQYYDTTASPLPPNSSATPANPVSAKLWQELQQSLATQTSTGSSSSAASPMNQLLSSLGAAATSSAGATGLQIPVVGSISGAAGSLSGLAILPNANPTPTGGTPGTSLESLAGTTIALAQTVQGVATTAQSLIGAAKYISSTVQNASNPLQTLAAVSNGLAVGTSAVSRVSGALGTAVNTIAAVSGAAPSPIVGAAVNAINQVSTIASATNNVAAPALNAAAALTAISQANNPVVAVQSVGQAAGSVAQAASQLPAAVVTMNQAASAIGSLTSNQGSL